MAACSVAPVVESPGITPRLTVIVPAHDNVGQLRECLKSLAASSYPHFDVIVVDDCSTADALRPVVAHYGAKYVRTSTNSGPAAARNVGARYATGEILVFVDSDVAIAPETLSRMAEDFEQNPDVAAVFGSYDADPACTDFLSQHKNLMHHYIHQISKEQAISFWAGCGAIRKPVFYELGGFDAAQFPKPSIEDIELGYRMSRAGKQVLLDKQIQAKHLKRWTLFKLLSADIFGRAVPWTKLILETKTLPRDLNLGYIARLSAILVAILAAGLALLPLSLANLRWCPPTSHLLLLSSAIVFALTFINRKMYAWFKERRGYGFVARVMLLHWVYYFYSGVVFVICVVTYRLSRSHSSTQVATSSVGSGN